MYALSLHFSFAKFNTSPVYPHPVGQSLNRQWDEAVTEAIRTGNHIHNELFRGKGIDIAVNDAIDAAGNHCHVAG